LRTIPDSRKIRPGISDRQVKQAVVVGGGFIGLEMTENLLHRGISVTLVEMLPQVMPAFDAEMMTQVHQRLQASGVQLLLGDGVSKFEQTADDRLCVQTRSGKTHLAELVILGIGVRPEAKLAKDAGLDIGEKGGIRVNENMKTNDDRIWAVGDAVEVRDYVTGEWVLIPLAGPANRQGRIAADNIFGREAKFRGVQGTTICGAFDLIMAATGANEKTLRRVGMEYEKVYLHPGHHVGYYPGAKPIAMKMLFSVPEGKVLGAQAVGEEGIEKRIDAIAMAIQRHSTVFDLEEAELCYAPQFGAAKDPVNMAGMIAANGLRGDAPVVHWEDIEGTDATIVDVREPGEFEAGHLEGAVNVPLSQLRERMDELPRDRPLWVYCQVGQRAYYATRALRLQGFDVYNLTGGFKTYQAVSS
jgi:NADPH-dependent 2,4-dienoyl-CoA reductase/sulfur reductase-like enzyme/rhodanese-related sulfurtransferase